MLEWAKMPSLWLAKTEDRPCPLAELNWRTHRTTATAALLLLIVLTIRLNQSHRKLGFGAARGHEVAVTYDEMQKMTGFARATIAKALMLLQGMGAIEIRRQGRKSVYGLPQVSISGGYCQLPQGYLLDGSPDILRRLRGLPLEGLAGLNAMKLYVLFLARRSQQRNTTAISYQGIMDYTGIRREDIPKAFSYLVAAELAGASDELDDRQQDRSKRYKVHGLPKAYHAEVTHRQAA